MFFWVTDVVTSWRHVMTSQNMNYLSQLRDVLESWFFFVSMIFLVSEFKNIIKFLIVGCRDVITSCHSVTIPDFWYISLEMCWKVDFFISMDFWSKSSKMLSILSNFNCLMSWCHDVMLWRHKTWFIIYLSQVVDVLESWFFFLFPWFGGSISSKMLLIIYLFEVVTSRRHVMTSQTLMYLSQHADVLERWFFFVSMVFWVTEFENVIEFYLFNVVTSWRHIMTSQNLIYLSQLVDVLEKWLFFCFHVFWVIEFKTVNDFLFIWCRHVMTSCHDVTKSASSISACGWARTMILFMIPWFNWLLISRMLSFMYYFCNDITS